MNKFTLSYRFLNGNVHGCVFAKNRPVFLNWLDYSVVIKKADKSSNEVIMNRKDYIAEVKRQLSNENDYEKLLENPHEN